jgi:hypothetical protein
MATKAPKTLSRRVLVEVKRGITSTTPLLVYEHEIPLLEVVHGEGTVKVVEEPVVVLDEGQKLKKKTENTLPSTHLGLGDVFAGDPRAEYDRLCQVYGMHEEVKMPICEYVYGRFSTGQFTRTVQTADAEDLSDRQVRERLESLKAEFDPKAPIDALRKQLTTELAAE